jgi:polar amino acid transport system substrate-binding protein
MLRYAMVLMLGLAFAVTSTATGNAEGAGYIAPTGALRVAVAVGPAASAFWTTRDPSTGKPRGVTVELAKAAADKLHVPLQLVEHQSSDEIAAASSKGVWDRSFMPADVKREQFVDQGPAYVAYMSGYLIRAGSDIRSVADVDRAGMRVGCIEGTSTSRTVEKSLKQAKARQVCEAAIGRRTDGKG